MEQGITTSDMQSSRGVKPNAEVQLAIAHLWDTIRKAGEILVAVRSDNAGLAARLSIVQSELHSYKERIAGLDEEREREQAALSVRDQELNTLREALEQAEKTARGQRSMMEEYADRTERYEETIRRLTVQVDAQATEIETLQQEHSDSEALRAEAEVQSSNVHTLTQTVASLQSQLAVATKKAEDADYLRAEVVRRNTELNARIKEAFEYKERAAELENKVFELGALQTALHQAKEQIQELQGENVAALLAHEEAQQRADDSEALRAELHALREQSRTSETALQQQVQQVQEESDTYRTLAEEQQERANHLAEQLQQLQETVPQYEHSATELHTRVAELQQHVEQVRRDKETAEQAQQQLAEQCEQLRHTCNSLRQELQESSKGVVSKDFIEEKEALLAELRAQLQSKEQEVEKMQRQLDTAYTTGSLFTSAAPDNARSAVIASVEALLHKVERALETENEKGEE